MNIYAITALFGSTSTLILGIFVYLQNKQRTLNRFFCLLSISIFFWVFGCFKESSVSTKTAALFWDRFLYTGGAFAPTLFLHVSLLVAEAKRKKILTTLYCLSIIFLFFNLIPDLRNFFIIDVEHKFPFRYIAVPAPIWYAYLSYFAFCGLYPFYILFRALRTEGSHLRREHLKYMVLSLVIIFIAASMYLSLVLSVASPPVDNLLVALFSLITAYLIVRHHVMDIRLAITRAGIFTLVYAFVLGIPFLFVRLAKPYLVGALSDRWWMGILVIAMALAGIGPFIYMNLKDRAEARILREERARHEALRKVSRNVLRFNKLDALLKAIVHSLVRIMRVKLAAIYLADDDKKSFILKSAWQPPLKRADLPEEVSFDSALVKNFTARKDMPLNIEEISFHSHRGNLLEVYELKKSFDSLTAQLIIPAFRNDKLMGFLVLGDKRSGLGYSAADIEVLMVLNNHTTLAIENAIFNEEERERQAILFHSASLASLGTMASMMGHQVNNRFQAVNNLAGFSEMLEIITADETNISSYEKWKGLIQQTIGRLRQISDEATKGGETVASIRRLGRLSSAEFKPIDLQEVLDIALGVLRYKIKFGEFDFNLDIPQESPKILGDSTQLGEVFFNLIDNAYDAIKERKNANNSPDYKARIAIKAYLKTDSKHIHIEVSDTGMGIKDEFKPRLFVPFYTTKASSGKGTGLGLHVIKRIIEFHNGKISVDSTYGKGTTFKIDLPIAEESAEILKISKGL
ncbi:MAG: hypothetical protein COV72_03980 [Candidatus Omnitrophica bacterium CG11_big_fil_rev_8_21_14_0_20_42_13]|uniref:histidine kinase n=1 Tax=Candidatus Ghiorseimicrobium undicola TaxID=1974746 RepID=A0A2H0LY06_9BACT|nr:MAG: hypothetical protein COV72_03980 [Candidatus Omnitrophica bacterium CG11_big_fil_rev_8_21_14_0_20_42_13]